MARAFWPFSSLQAVFLIINFIDHKSIWRSNFEHEQLTSEVNKQEVRRATSRGGEVGHVNRRCRLYANIAP